MALRVRIGRTLPDEHGYPLLGPAGPQALGPRERGQAVQRAPPDLGQRVDVASRGDRRKHCPKCGESVLEFLRRLGSSERSCVVSVNMAS